MIVHVITLFPELIDGFASAGVLGRAAGNGLLEVRARQLRDFSEDRHRTVDDYPYGGGAGMILKPDIVARALRQVKSELSAVPPDDVPVVLTTPHGRRLDAAVAREYAACPEWIIICGHYGGVDQRVADTMATDEISIGDYVLMGGELPALAVIEAAARFVPGVLGNTDSAERDTFEDSLLGPPLYTRPQVFDNLEAPQVLLSGHHAEIDKWRRRKQLESTLRRRPDLLDKAVLSDEDLDYLETLGYKRNRTE